MARDSAKARLFVLLFCSDFLVVSQGKPKPPDLPVWEFYHEYELFLKVYEQTQTIQKLLNQVLHKSHRCPDSWTELGGSCYFLPLHWKKKWLDAEATCERLGGYLAILNSEEEDIRVSEHLANVSSRDLQQNPAYIWIGGFDFSRKGDWRWVNGEGFNYTNWRVDPKDSPAAIRAKESCLDWSNGWNDNMCDRKFHFLCEKDKLGNYL